MNAVGPLAKRAGAGLCCFAFPMMALGTESPGEMPFSVRAH